jgi:hypothetical protein
MTNRNDDLHPFVEAWREKQLAEVNRLTAWFESFGAPEGFKKERWRDFAKLLVNKPERAVQVAEQMAIEYGFDPALLARTIRAGTVEIDDVNRLTSEIYERLVLIRLIAKSKRGASVRSMNLVPPSLLKYMLGQLVMNCSAQELALPFKLANAVCEGMDVHIFGENEARKLEEKCFAALLEADDRMIGVRQLARQVGVTPPTVTAWRKDPGYKASVERLRNNREELARAMAQAADGEPPDIRFA